jgi:hypothetical protein
MEGRPGRESNALEKGATMPKRLAQGPLIKEAHAATASFQEHALEAFQKATKFLKTLDKDIDQEDTKRPPKRTAEDIAKPLGISKQYFDMLLGGHKPLRPEHAMRLFELVIAEIERVVELTWEQAGLLLDCIEAWEAAVRAWFAAMHGPAVKIAERIHALGADLSDEQLWEELPFFAADERLLDAVRQGDKLRKSWKILRDMLVNGMLRAKPELKQIYAAALAGTRATPEASAPQGPQGQAEAPKRRRGRPRTRALPQRLR